jgi:hypothetical protein
MSEPDRPRRTPAEQQRYARLLDRSTKVGFAILVVSFLAYGFGAIPAHVPHDGWPKLLHLPLASYLRETGIPTGWGWLAHVHKGEFTGLGGIVILSGCSLLCLCAVVPVFLKRGDRIYAAICVAEIAVMLLAASGVLAPGH